MGLIALVINVMITPRTTIFRYHHFHKHLSQVTVITCSVFAVTFTYLPGTHRIFQYRSMHDGIPDVVILESDFRRRACVRR